MEWYGNPTVALGLSAGQWYHLSFTFRQTSVNVIDYYRNGALVSSSNGSSATSFAWSNPIRLGDINNGSAGRYSGLLDDFRIYNRALNASEVLALYNGNQATASGVYVLGSALDINGNLFLNGGTLDASATLYNITLAGNLQNAGGFTKRTGTVTLDGTSQTLSGSTVFYNLKKNVTAAATLWLDYTSRQSASGALTLSGVTSNVLSLRSTRAGSGSRLLLDGDSGTQAIEFLDVKDNNAAGGATLTCLTVEEGCVNSGNNTNWSFAAGSKTITGTAYADEGSTVLSSGKQVSVSLNGGSVAGSGLTVAGGQYTITGLHMTGGTIVALYLDGASEDAVTVTLWSGSSMTGMHLYQNRLIVRSDSGSIALANSHLDVADNSGDSDITALYTVNSSVLNVKSGKALTVWTGKTFTPGANVNVGSGITINGTFRPAGNTVTLSGSWTRTGTFHAAGSTVAFNGGSTATLTSGGTGPSGRFYHFTVNKPSGTLTLGGNALAVSGALTLANGTFNANALTVSASGAVSLTGGTYLASTALQLFHGNMTVNGGTFTGSTGPVTVSGVTLTSGTLTAPSGTFTVKGNWTKRGGTFTPGTNTVTLGGTHQTLSGSTAFWNLAKTVTSAATLTFSAGGTQTVSGALTLRGTSSNLLSVRSSIAGTQAALTLDGDSGTQTIDYLDVKDSNAAGGARLVCLIASEGCADSGGNPNWRFRVTGSGTVNGLVWSDLNGNGRKGSDETSGLSGVTITLVGTTMTGGSLSLSRATNSLGQFAFSGTTVSDTTGYTVAVTVGTLPANELRTRFHSSGSNILGTGGLISVNFGYVAANTLSGSVFLDPNGNAVKDSGENTVFSGVTLVLSGTSGTGGTVSVTKKSNASGTYLFSGLPTSTGSTSFTVAATPPTGYVTTSTDSRSVTFGTGGQIKHQHFGYAVSSSSSSSPAGGGGSGGGETGGGGGGRRGGGPIVITPEVPPGTTPKPIPPPPGTPPGPPPRRAQTTRERGLARRERPAVLVTPGGKILPIPPEPGSGAPEPPVVAQRPPAASAPVDTFADEAARETALRSAEQPVPPPSGPGLKNAFLDFGRRIGGGTGIALRTGRDVTRGAAGRGGRMASGLARQAGSAVLRAVRGAGRAAREIARFMPETDALEEPVRAFARRVADGGMIVFRGSRDPGSPVGRAARAVAGLGNAAGEAGRMMAESFGAAIHDAALDSGRMVAVAVQAVGGTAGSAVRETGDMIGAVFSGAGGVARDVRSVAVALGGAIGRGTGALRQPDPVLPPQEKYRTVVKKQEGAVLIATLHMSVFDSLGSPLRKTPVVLFSTPKIAVTDTKGVATFRDVETGPHKLEVHVSGDHIEKRDIIIEPPSGLTLEEQTQIDVVLPVIQVIVAKKEEESAGMPSWASILIVVLLAGNGGLGYILVRRRRDKLIG